MNLTLRIMRKVFYTPLHLAERFESLLKATACVLGNEAKLYPSSRIENSQGRRDAIIIAANSKILGELLVLGHGGAIRVGESCFIGEGSRIWSADSITIGDRVLISHNVNIHDHNSHSLSAHNRQLHFDAMFKTGHPKVLEDVASAPIVIEDDAWIGFNSTILKGVTIGKGAVIGASTLVTKDVPAYAIVAGNPFRVIGEARP